MSRWDDGDEWEPCGCYVGLTVVVIAVAVAILLGGLAAGRWIIDGL